ncbi:MAG: hypothetical protein AMXMBFR8_01360 [Nevskiales bacterium]
MSAVMRDALRASVIPGLAVVAAIALSSRLVAEFLGSAIFSLGHSPVSPVMIAVLAGIAVRNTIGVSPLQDKGLALATGTLLRCGLALVGLRLTLSSIGVLGLRALPVVAGCLAVAWLAIPRIARGLGLRGALVSLLTVGTSICGCTAVMAVAPVLKARAAETGYAVTIVVVIGLAGALLYPALAHTLFADAPAAAGVFLGTAIHDTSQVMGAALIYSDQYLAPEALEAATVTKLMRNLTLVLVVPVLAAMQARAGAAASGTGSLSLRKLVPGFVFAFVGLAALRSLGDVFGASSPAFVEHLWQPALALAAQLSELLLIVGMAGVGLNVELRDLRHVGWQPLAAGLIAALLLATTSLALISALL